jgi:uncharacterized protein
VPVDLHDLDVEETAITDLAGLGEALRDAINADLAMLTPAPTVNVAIAPSAEADGQHFLRITATSGERASVRVRRATASDLAAALMLGTENGGIEMARRSDFRPAPNGSLVRATGNGGAVAGLNTLAGLPQNGLTGITIGSEGTIPLAALVTTDGGDPWTADDLANSPNANSDGIREKLRIIAQAINAAPGSRYRAELHGYDLAILAKVGTFNEVPSAIEFTGPQAAQANPLVQLNTRQYTLGPNGTSAFAAFDAAEQTGDDGGAPGFNDYVGDPIAKSGLHALDEVDLFNLLLLPADRELDDDARQQLWGPSSIYAQSRRAFLLIDAPDTWTDGEGRPSVVQNTDEVRTLRSTVVNDHSGIFYPKILYNDAGLVRSIGSSGAIAGVMARTDATRGVWKAPAGTEADIRGIVGLQAKLTDLENGVLNKLGVNCARSLPAGFVNWGARTLDGDDDLSSEWKYIPIRRLALMMEESLYRGTQWVVFEPNDEPLWAKIRLNVGVFMNGLFRQGAFQGSTPSDAFYVKCDGETTTQADRNLGIVNIEIGFAPLKPAEFVIITIQQIAGDLG